MDTRPDPTRGQALPSDKASFAIVWTAAVSLLFAPLGVAAQDPFAGPSVLSQTPVGRQRTATTLTPIISPSRTSPASCAASQPSVPAGRSGRTIQR